MRIAHVSSIDYRKPWQFTPLTPSTRPPVCYTHDWVEMYFNSLALVVM